MNTTPAPDTYAALEAYVEQERRRLAMPGVALAVVAGDRLAHSRGLGQAQPGGPAPGPDTLFLAGSLTKSFTALAVMQLVEAGRVELEAPVQRYLPWFRLADAQYSAAVTVRHLLCQTSGLTNLAGEVILADFDERLEAAERQARALAAQPLTRAPGAAWEYSNSNYQVLGLIIEAISGERYAAYVERHILRPLGMRHSAIVTAPAHRAQLALGHQYWFGRPVAAPYVPLPYGAAAGGLLVTNAEDLGRWLSAHLSAGRGEAPLLSSAGFAELHRGAATIETFGLSMQYGMGWFVDRLGPAPILWHSGTLPNFGAYMALLPEQQQGLVLLFNGCHHWLNPVLIAVGMGAATRLASPAAAGGQPSQSAAPVGLMRLLPWALRAQALLPVVQAAGLAAWLRQLSQRRRVPWPQRALAFAAGLLPALSLWPVLGRRRGYLKWYMPDFSLIAWVSGGLALAGSLAGAWLGRRGRVRRCAE